MMPQNKLATTPVRCEPVGKGLVPLWSDAGKCWCVSDQWFYRFEYASSTLTKVFRLPPKSRSVPGRLKDVLARSAWRQQLWPRANIHHLVELPGGDVVVVYDKIYHFVPGSDAKHARAIETDLVPRLDWPLRGGMAVHPGSACVYFGEYNDNPRGVRVVRVHPSTQTVEVCWHFPRNEIRHIHAIHHDRYRNRLWICTGDRDHESALYFTDDEFQTVQRFAGGDQTWRAIALLFDENGMEWGMDAGQDARADDINRIFRHDFATGKRTELAVIGNPVYAACGFDDGTAVMQTSFEPKRQQDTPAETALWWRDHERQWQSIMSLPFKAHEPRGVGRYGHLMLPVGVSPAGQLLCTPVNTASHALTLLHLRWASESTQPPA